MDVVGLLQSKNRCLQRLLGISQDFLSVIGSDGNGNFDGLTEFENNREAIIRTIDLLDRRVTDAVRNLNPDHRTPMLTVAVERELNDKNALIQKIIESDNKIIKAIEQERDRISKELASSEKNKIMMKKFKSGWIAESGEELDKKL